MKVQCSCGAKYSFDVTPEMAQHPVQLVCQTCGTDISSPVNELIRQQLQPAAPAPVQPEAPASPAPAAPAASGKLRMRVSTAAPTQTETAPESTDELPVCRKHPPHRTTHKCRICQKPICPECMALFGFVCSPHCKAKASANGIE